MHYFDRYDGTVPWKYFRGVSKNFREQHYGGLEIILHCFNINPDRRPSITQLVNHPYIADAPANPTTDIINELFDVQRNLVA